jgi:hypothetical protein
MKHRFECLDLVRAMMVIGQEWEADTTLESASAIVKAEVKRRVKAVKLSHEEQDPYVDFGYVPSHRPDRIQAARRFVQRQLFEKLHPGPHLLNYRQREAKKRAAWSIIGNAALPLPDRIESALQVIAMHFARSVWSALSDGDPLAFLRHPGFREYARHYLHADPDFWAERFRPDVAAVLLDLYPKPAHQRIAPGRTYWNNINNESGVTA